MKNLLIIISLCLASMSSAFSQNYRAVEWEVLGGARLITTDGTTGNAIALNTEARFNVNNKISVGMRFGWQFFDNIHDELIRGLGVAKSFSFTGDYYVSNKLNKRAFVGLGLGSFNNEAITESGKPVGGSGFGVVPRVGYELGSFLRLTAAYNHAFEESYPNYFSIGLGLNIGGGYK